MKQPLSRRRLSRLSSFTLVELIVVIGIILILASVILYAGGVALKAAKRTQAANMATQIQTACLAYYTEYSVYPIPSGATAGSDVLISSSSTDQTYWKNLTWALCGNIDPAFPTASVTPTVANTRAIVFITLRLTDVEHSTPPVSGDSGIPLNPIYPTGAGTYFNIALDGSYDGLLGNTTFVNGAGTAVSGNPITNYASASMPAATITQGVAVWANCNTLSGTNNNFYVRTY